MRAGVAFIVSKSVQASAAIFFNSTQETTINVLTLRVDGYGGTVDFHFPEPDLLKSFCNVHSITLDDSRSNCLSRTIEEADSKWKYRHGYRLGSLAFWDYVLSEIPMIRPVSGSPEYLLGWDDGRTDAEHAFNKQSKLDGE